MNHENCNNSTHSSSAISSITSSFHKNENDNRKHNADNDNLNIHPGNREDMPRYSMHVQYLSGRHSMNAEV
jgi:hypothetical protein